MSYQQVQEQEDKESQKKKRQLAAIKLTMINNSR